MAAVIHRYYLVGVFIGVVIVFYTLSLSEEDLNPNTTTNLHKIGGLNAPNDGSKPSAYDYLRNLRISEAISASRSECASNYEKWYQAMVSIVHTVTLAVPCVVCNSVNLSKPEC